jgi:hypothetical protein
MEKSRMIRSRFWRDDYIQTKLNPLDRYLFLYFITNDKTNISGIYEVPLKIIAVDTGLDMGELERSMLPTLKEKIAYYNGWVIIKNFQKHQNIESPSIVRAIQKEILKIPKEVLEYAISIGYLHLVDTLSTPYGQSESKSESKHKVRVFKNKSGKAIELKTGANYKPDYNSPLDTLKNKKRLERLLGLKKTNEWGSFIFGSGWDFLKAYKNTQGIEYNGNVLLDEIVKNMAGWYAGGETRETIREMLTQFFSSEKSQRLTISPRTAFSTDTYNSWKQGKLIKATKTKKWL